MEINKENIKKLGNGLFIITLKQKPTDKLREDFRQALNAARTGNQKFILIENEISIKNIDDLIERLLKNWFVVTPKSKDNPDGDVWGMDTSLGTIDEVKGKIKEDIEKELIKQR